MRFGGIRYRVRCGGCGWRGVRTSIQCECYEDWALYCRPDTPGPGCPAGVGWPCPKCKAEKVRTTGYAAPRKPLAAAVPAPTGPIWPGDPE